jgi:glycosyltransferase involved in cell wall biosynthesis
MIKSSDKLCIIAPHLVQYHAPLYKEIAKINTLDVTVVYLDTMGYEAFVDTEFNQQIKWDNSLLDGYKYKFLKNYANKPLSGFFSRINPGVFKELASNKYDVVLIPGYATLSYCFSLLAAKLTGTKIIWRGEATLRGNENNDRLISLVKRKLLNLFLSLCDIVMYSCSGNKAYINYYLKEKKALTFFPCAVDNVFFQNEKKKINDEIMYKLKNDLQINKDDLVILFCARFTKRKRPEDLLHAISMIDHNDITVVFVGDGHEKESLESYAKQHAIKICFVGFKSQEELPAYYSIADLLVVTSDYDPSPKVINEAMNFELPVIVTDIVGTASDLIHKGENGFIIPVGDVDKLAEKIELMNSERELAKTMGLKSLEIVSNWSLERCAKSIENSIKGLKSSNGI